MSRAGRTIPLTVLTVVSLLCQPPLLHSQDPPPEVTTDAPTQPQDGTCETPGTSVPSPITINTYGGCTSGTGDAGDAVKDDVQRLTSRVVRLETAVTALGSGGSGGSGGSPCPNLQQFGIQPFTDCDDIKANGTTTDGVYEIRPRGSPYPFNVVCEFTPSRTYTVFQSRQSGLVDFQRSWAEYQRGFGKLELGMSFWAGLDPLYFLTRQRQYGLRIDLTDFSDRQRVAQYDAFSIGPESDRYRLKVFFYNQVFSTAGDALSNYHNYIPFSTFDNDNDYASQNCPLEHGGGWWYRDCDNANLNGIFHDTPNLGSQQETGIEWDTWLPMYSLRRAKMKVFRKFPASTNIIWP